MLKLLFIGCFVCCSINNMYAQKEGFVYSDSTLMTEAPAEEEEEAVEEVPVTDTTLYTHVIAFPKDTIAAWKMDKRFAYVKILDSLLKAKQQEEMNSHKSSSGDGSLSFFARILSSGVLKIFFWAIAICFVLFIIYRLFINNGIFRKAAQAGAVKEMEEQEKIMSPADFDALVRQSFKLGDYRMAVRYLFLKSLRQLADKGHLQHSVEKTNYQYVQEIKADKKKDFASLVLNYEYIWYGHLNISREQYEYIEKSYISFNNKI